MNESLKVIVSQNDYHVWLLNGTNEGMELRAGELFGFGQGEFKPLPLGGKHAGGLYLSILLQAWPKEAVMITSHG